MFSKDSGHQSGTFSSLFEATQKARNTCFGYLDLVSTSEVKKQLPKKGKKVQFSVKDGDCSVVFGTETEAERDDWIEVIRESIKGVVHFLPIAALELPEGAMGVVLGSDSRSRASSSSGPGAGHKQDVRRSMIPAAIDFPSKGGFLKKSSQGKGTFAISVVKKRWFRLAAGELRYYEDEDESAAKLKECIHLDGATILPPAGTSSSALCLVHIQFAGGRAMKLEASTAKIATEWRDAFSQTIAILVNMPSARNANAPPKPTRRLNIHDNATDKGSVHHPSEVLGPASPLSNVATPTGRAKLTRAATMSSSGISPKRMDNEDEDSDEEGPLESLSSSFWGGWGSSSKSNAPAGNSPMAKARSQSVSVSPIATSDYRPKFAQRAPGTTIKTADTVELLKECLSQNFLVKRLPDLVPLIDLMEEKIAVPGEVIIWQGSSGDAFYALESGQCDVLKDGRHVAKIAPGKTFGDLALVNNATRQATIRATQVCRLWLFTRNQFRDLAVKQETEQMEERVIFLQQIDLFHKLVRASLEKIAEVMVLKSYNTGERIIKQGDAGDAFYMILSGRVVVTQTTTFGSSAGTELARLGPGKSFGDLALIEDAPRKATVTASSACKCWTLDRHSFKSLFGSMDEALNESIGVSMLQKVRILEALTARQLQVVARCLVSKKFNEGEVIIKQGDVGDSFYLIAKGEVSVQVNHIQVAALGSGSFFGEMSLLSNEKRSATVTAITEVSCLVLSRSDFQEHLGTIEEVNEEARRRKEAALRPKGGDAGGSKFLSSLRKVSESFFSASPTSSPTQTLARAKSMGNVKGTNALFSSTNAMFDLGSLERVKKIGSGTFGTVFLVQHIMTNKLFAMKVLHKQQLKDKCQENYVYSERDIMLTLVESQYAAALYATMQDAKSIYLVMQYVPGGDLWNLLYKSTTFKRTKEGGIPLASALFYIANVLVAINHIHDQDIIYRNIKPENLVVDGTGYLKIVDFGSAKRLSVGQKTNTVGDMTNHTLQMPLFNLFLNLFASPLCFAAVRRGGVHRAGDGAEQGLQQGRRLLGHRRAAL